MNDKQIRTFIKTGEIARKQIGDGLYLRVQTAGKAYWEVRYSMNGKRRFMRIAGGQYPSMSLVKIQDYLNNSVITSWRSIDRGNLKH